MRLNRVSNERGFTLLESLLQLVVLVLFSSISILIILWAREIQDINQIKHDVNWELFVYDMQQYNQNSLSGGVVSSGMMKFKPADDEENRTFFYEKPNDHIRKRSNKGGNETMLPFVKQLHYEQLGNEIVMKVVTEDGKLRERILVSPLPE